MGSSVNTVSVHIQGSRFTLRDFSQFLSPTDSYSSQLSVVAHIDCNCFFAQVERNRLGLKIEAPLVCVQWHSIIAVSYSARDFGISRMDKLVDAKLKCPQLIPVHTAVFKKDNDFWEYLDNQPFPHAADHKVSLDPYRRASVKILKLLKSITRQVEKASVDEWFINLNELIFLKLSELIPSFSIDGLRKDDPLPNITNLELEMDGLLYGFEPGVDKITDYDDLFIVLGGIVTTTIRHEIFDKLRYQTSCGVSNNKKLAKLLSNFKKPDAQTILLNRKIPDFLENFKLSDVNSFGGKTGAHLINDIFGDQSITAIQRQFPLSTIQRAVKDEKLASKIHKIINGVYKEPVSLSKDLIKSMNSNKNLLNGTNGDSFNACKQWINIFSIDLKQRLMEYNYELDKFSLKPRNLTLRVLPKGNFPAVSKTVQLKFVMDSSMNEIFLSKALELLSALEKSFLYPLVNISLTISNFEQVSKEENNIVQMFKNTEDSPGTLDGTDGMKYINVGKIKESKAQSKVNIMQMFKTKEPSETADQTKCLEMNETDRTSDEENKTDINGQTFIGPITTIEAEPSTSSCLAESSTNHNDEVVDNYRYSNKTITCIRCGSTVEDIIEHNDFHFALELSKEINNEQQRQRPLEATQRPSQNHTTPSNGKQKQGATKKRKVDGKQSRLPF